MKSSALAFNILQLILGAATGPFAGSMMGLPTHEDNVVSKAVMLSVVCASAVLAICTFAYIVSPREQRWVRPSLEGRVYFIGQPLQTFFLAACVFLAASLGCVVGMTWMNSGYPAIFFLSIGAGCMVGTGLSVLLFRDRLLPA